MAGPVEAGSWAPLRFHTGTPAWYRTGEWYRTGPDRQRRRGRGGDPTPWLFGTLGVPPPGPPRDLSEPHFLGQLRALKAEREILERELELARINRMETHLWDAPLPATYAPQHPSGGVGAATRGWAGAGGVPRAGPWAQTVGAGPAAVHPRVGANTLRPASAPLQQPPQRQHQQLGAALAAQQHEIETLRAELATMRRQLGERRATQARGKATSQVDNRQTVAAIYKRYNPAKLAGLEPLLREWQGKEELLVRLLRRKYGEP